MKSELDVTWTIAGVAELTGANWDSLATENDMSTSDNIVYTLVKHGCKLEEGIGYAYKVLKNHRWEESYGSNDGGNAHLWVEQTGEYTVTFTFNSADHILYSEATRTGDYVPGEKIWTIVGVSDLLGKEWDLTATENDMVYKGNGLYVLHKYRVTLLADTQYAYKVAASRSWAINYGADDNIDGPNAVLTVDSDGMYDVKFTFSIDTKQLSAEVTYSSGTWTIAGVSDLTGTEWDPTDTENDMVLDESGYYVLLKKNVALLSSTGYEYKVVADHSWTINYGADDNIDGPNAVLTVDSDGMYDVKFSFSVDTKQLSAEATYKSEYIPVIPELDNVKAYYYVGALNQWSPSDKSYPFSLLDDGKTWELTITSFENDGWFKIAPDFAYENRTTFWDNLLCAPFDGCEELSGNMLFGHAGAWHLPQSDSIYSYTIRMIPSEMTYSIEITPVVIQNESDAIKVLDSNGNDVTNETEIIWYDTNKNRIANGSAIGGIAEGTEVYYSVLLNQQLGMCYREVILQKTIIDRSTRTISLQPIEKVTLHGKVVAYGTALPRVNVSLAQWLNGKYEYETSALTDANGEFSLNVYNDSTVLIVTANGYVDNKTVRRNLNSGGELGNIDMIEVQGKVIALNLNYQEATREGAEPIVQNWYSDTRNIEYTVQNVTKDKEIEDFAIQHGNIVMPTGTDRGDLIQITVRSLNERFVEATAEGIIADNDTANVSINLLAFGGIEATYEQKADDNLLAMLYDSAGKLQMRTVCSTSRLTFTNLAAGKYTIVTMGYNGAIGSVSDISDLASMDLAEGTDYVRSTATVRDGYIASVNVASVPELDASKFEYTGMNTSYLPNKTQLVSGNFITLSVRLDFKEQYAGKADNAKVVVDIPEGCEFVPNSVVIGAKPIPHSLNGNKLTITVDQDDIDRRIRFCVIPTQAGTYMTTAYVEFDYKGTKTQPMGQVKFESTSGELYVPSTTKTPTITLGGIGVPKADVEVYDNEALIGTTKSLGNGKWSLKCDLNNAYNLSTHEIYVKYRGDGNITGVTEVKECFYDINAIVPKTVTMVNTAHPAGNLTPKVYENVFDYETVIDLHNYYLYWPLYPDFTFLIDLSENDTTKVSDVTLYVHTTDGDSRKLPTVYDGKLNRFVATSSFDMYSLPVNVSVDVITNNIERTADRQYINDGMTIASEAFNQRKTEVIEIDTLLSSNNYSMDNEAIYSELENLLSTCDYDEQEVEELLKKLFGTYSSIGDSNISEDDFALIDADFNNHQQQIETVLLNEQTEGKNTFLSSLMIDMSIINSEMSTNSFNCEKNGNNMSYSYTIEDALFIDEEELLSEGYTKIPITDGSVIYCLITENASIYIDSAKKKKYSFNCENIVNGRLHASAILTKDCLDAAKDILKKIKNDSSDRPTWVNNAELYKIVMNSLSCFYSTAIASIDSRLHNALNQRLTILDPLIEAEEMRLEAYRKWISEQKVIPADKISHMKEIERNLCRLRQQRDNVKLVFERIFRPLERLPKSLNANTQMGQAVKAFGKIAGGLGVLVDIYECYVDCRDAAEEIKGWVIIRDAAENKKPCKLNEEQLNNIINGIIRDTQEVMGVYFNIISGRISKIGIDAASLVSWEAPLAELGLYVASTYTELFTECYKVARITNGEFVNRKTRHWQELRKLKCDKDDDDDDDDDNNKKKRKGTDNKNGENDPSGFVYEAVPTNRIEGVKATLYYSEYEDGAYPTPWDAAEFGQINPQITDESGLYAWDVPQGFWKVIFEKEGYETTETEWLPVPPPQLEVNIPMSQAVAPYVENATGAESGITLDFSKYMKPNTLTKSKRVTVTVNGKNAGGDVELLNAEENPFNKEEYASKIKFVPNTSFKTTDEVIITVKKEVESYAGKEMTEDFVQRVKIESEITEIACDSIIAVDYQGTGVLEVSVLPAAAAKGKTIQVASTSTMIASANAQSVTLNDEGKARIVISGELPGNASLHLSMPEAGKEKYVTVNVVTKEDEVVKAPKASKLSGSEFENSYMLSLTCATKGATIYYTIDGSCPCDEQTRKKYTGPITFPEGQVTLQAIAVREGLADSDIATFNYTVTKDVTGIKVIEESRDFDANYQDGAIVITGAKGASCHIYDLQGRELATRSRISNHARINVPKTDVYVISVTFANEQTVVHKIMAK